MRLNEPANSIANNYAYSYGRYRADINSSILRIFVNLFYLFVYYLLPNSLHTNKLNEPSIKYFLLTDTRESIYTIVDRVNIIYVQIM